MVPGTTRIAGLSGGSYTAVFTELGYSGREQANLWKGLMSGLGTGGLTVAVEKMIDEKLTDDDVKRGDWADFVGAKMQAEQPALSPRG